MLCISNCYLTAQQPTLCHSQGDRLTNLMNQTVLRCNITILRHSRWQMRKCLNMLCIFNCYLAAQQPTLCHSQGDRLTNLMNQTVLRCNITILRHSRWQMRKCLNMLCIFNCYLAAQQPTLCHSQGDRLTNLLYQTAFRYNITIQRYSRW